MEFLCRAWKLRDSLSLEKERARYDKRETEEGREGGWLRKAYLSEMREVKEKEDGKVLNTPMWEKEMRTQEKARE